MNTIIDIGIRTGTGTEIIEIEIHTEMMIDTTKDKIDMKTAEDIDKDHIKKTNTKKIKIYYRAMPFSQQASFQTYQSRIFW